MKITAVAPCSSANLGSGFDALAIALDAFYDRVTVDESHTFRVIGDGVPADPVMNTAGLAALSLIDDMDISRNIEIRIEKGIPKGLGLGSSGASAAAAVVALDSYFGLELTREELVKYAMIGESAASGSPHPDNVAASIFGGLTLVTRDGDLKVSRLPISHEYRFLIAIPDVSIENKTRMARQMIPTLISLNEYSRAIARTASLIAGLMHGDRDMIRIGMNDDVVESSRLPLFPYYPDVKKSALEYNAVGVAVSGAGPSILILCDELSDIESIKRSAELILSKHGISCRLVEAGISGGAYVEGSPISD
ncbi:homoserine kinase [Thermoplasma sp. Kam2015]|uniref:homoserine kinase n=1 Tax=Thermoplasma sp. Kam2015 TaxID=2094122 RepID=UPI000D81D7F7|nr:homoserine kinase [Thermoplasma sp. Kam2015]PYB68750.1 homoserine kinase [Thermoplasma sp. Kam2015]